MSPTDAAHSMDTATPLPSWHRLIACLIGVAFALATFSPGYIAGTGPYWQSPQGDTATAQIGWQYYARDDWRWPVFAVENYHQPEGSTVLLSDSLPLVALPMKAVYKLTGWLPVYVGVWVTLCLVLQALCAWRLLVALGIRDLATLVAGTLLFCYMPLLLLRFGHATLMGHFFILIALERYVTAKRKGLSPRGWLALCALPVVTILTHPYMAAMCAALVFVTVIDQWRERRLDARGAVLRLGGSALATIFVALVGGLFRGGGQPFDDYGVYSLNLLAPFEPLANSRLGALLHTAQPDIPGLGQGEGLCYLGAGILLLCVLALPALRNARTNLRRHGVLVAVLIFLLIFAVSHRVGFGAHELVHVPLPAALIHVLSVFRGSGRFVWLAVYGLLAASLVAVTRRHGRRSAMVIVVVAAAIQFADVRPMQVEVRSLTASGAAATIDRTEWSRLIGAHDRLFEFPSFECGGLFANGIPGPRLRELEIDWLAAQRGKPTNSTYLARSIKDCARERDSAITDAGRAGTLYLYRSEDTTGAYLASHGVGSSGCGTLDDVVVCSSTLDLSALK